MKKLLSLFLAVLLIVMCIPFSASAAATSGKCGDNVKWSYSSGTLTISGTGAMYDYEENYSTGLSIPWFSYWNNIEKIVIKKGVTSIGKNAFVKIPNFKSVTIPEGVTKIGDSAFNASGWCSSLTLPSTLKEIGENAFRGWTRLTKVTIPGSVKTIGKGAFLNCGGLTTVTINNGVTTIGESAFEATAIRTLSLPASLVTVEKRAFYRSSVPTFTIPKNVKNIGDGAFASWQLTKITVDSANPYYSSDANGVLFNKNKTELIQFPTASTIKNYTVPKSVKVIRGYAFYEARKLESVTLNEGVVSIGEGAFYNSTVKKINLPKGLTDIGESAFSFSDIEEAILPSSLNNIGDYAFRSCSNLKNVVFEFGIKNMGYSMFENCENISTMTIPYTLQSISFGMECAPFGMKISLYEGSPAHKYILNGRYYDSFNFIGRYREFNNVIIICDNIKCFNTDDDLSVFNISNTSQYVFDESQVYRCFDANIIGYKEYNPYNVTLGCPVTLKIRVPENVPAGICTLYKINEDGTMTKLNPKTEGDYFVLTTDTLGKFAITGSVKRVSGTSRIDTALDIANNGWESADTVIIANAYNFADALAGGPLSYALDAPIILTANNEILERNVSLRIKSLGAKNIVILGGKLSVNEDIENTLKLADYNVKRISGPSRFETAIAIADELASVTGGYSKDVFIAYGNNYPDALAVSAVAALKGTPILFSGEKGSIDTSTADYINRSQAENATILGGFFSVAESAETTLKDLGLKEVDRVSGASRYDTAFAIVNKYSDIFTGDDIVFATGESFPDALAGGSFAAKISAPVILVSENKIADGVLDYIAEKNPKTVYVLGGINTVSDSTVKNYLAK